MLAAQAIGSLIVTVSTFAVAMIVMYAVNALGQLRVSAEGEAYGLDLHEHGIPAYPEYVITAAGQPQGVVHYESETAPAGKQVPKPAR